MAQVMKAKREENIPVLSGRLVLNPLSGMVKTFVTLVVIQFIGI